MQNGVFKLYFKLTLKDKNNYLYVNKIINLMKNLLYFFAIISFFAFTACSGGSSEGNAAEETAVEPAVETVEEAATDSAATEETEEATEEGGE